MPVSGEGAGRLSMICHRRLKVIDGIVWRLSDLRSVIGLIGIGFRPRLEYFVNHVSNCVSHLDRFHLNLIRDCRESSGIDFGGVV
jgi:hypothetical protein